MQPVYKWFALTSPCIKPIGWCHSNGIQIEEMPASYCENNELLYFPSSYFVNSEVLKFEKNQKLEAVDQWNPILIRVCTILDIFYLDSKPSRLKLGMDGWPDAFSFWVDVDSNEIYPPGYCSSVGYPLTLPNEFLGPGPASTCPTPECRGQGHVKGPRFLTHHNTSGCPYSVNKIQIPDRLSTHTTWKPSSSTVYLNNNVSVDAASDVGGNIQQRVDIKEEIASEANEVTPSVSEATPCKQIKCEFPSPVIKSEPSAIAPKKPKVCCDKNFSEKELNGEDFLERAIYNSVFGLPTDGPYTELRLCFKHRRKLMPSVKKPDGLVCHWTPEDVAKFVDSIPSCNGQIFIKEQIDGEAFLLLTQADIVGLLNVKIGPALKIYHSIQILQNFERKLTNVQG